jgi:hypothetical protein
MPRSLIAITLVTSLSASVSAFADDGAAAPISAPRIRVQTQLELLPAGRVQYSEGLTVSGAQATAYAFGGSLEFQPTRYVSIGVAPRLVFNITPDGDQSGIADRELELRAIIRGRLPVTPRLEIYASFLPGYADLHSGSYIVYLRSGGYTVGGAFGFTYDLGETLFAGGEIGYQRSLLHVDQTSIGDRLAYDMELSYPHLGVGFGMRF